MANSSAGKIPGIDRAAILLMTLGESAAAEVLKHMGPKEVQKIGAAMAALSSVSKDQVSVVLDHFSDEVDKQTNLGVGSDEYIRKVLVQALGADKAGNVIDRILLGGNSKGLEALKWMDPRAVAELIRLEHPQIIAIVLSYLEADQASAVLLNLPEKTRSDILLRIATLDGIQPSALRELDDIMEKQFSGNSANNVKSSSVGGVKAAANIMNMLDSTQEQKIMELVKEADAKLGEKIEDLMFVFEDLQELDDRGVQTLLREVSSESLILALKGSNETMREKIFKNMSKRAAEMLRDDLAAKGPVKLADVEKAQKEILTIARRMSDAGELALGGKGGEQYV
jgi:flagellar motor switch protein FliG